MMARHKKDNTHKTSVKNILTNDSPWNVQEAYKVLRTNIIFSTAESENKCKVIGVTSTAAREGKSTNAINLAISFAQINKKVLVIDGDLRKPTIASLLNIKGTPGVSDYLVGQADLRDCLRWLEKYKIYVLPSGSIPPDATWLLQSKQMDSLIRHMMNALDYIIIDMPPVMAVADAYIMAKNVDGYAIVVRHNETDVRMLRSALEQLKKADAHVFGFIYNDVNETEHGYYKYAYKYK